MLSGREYSNFKFAMNKILKDCKLDSYESSESATMLQGNSSETKDNRYYYDREQVLKHKEDLIELCKTLPKLKTIVSGTARNNSLF